jgi:alkylhydroperoxidase family enzyme
VRAADELRGRVPEVARCYEETRATVLESGLVDGELKLLCARYLAQEIGDFEPYGDRERAALQWCEGVAWNADRADDDLWARLHAHFSEPELVELGYVIAFTLGQMHFLRTRGLRPDPASP